MNSTNKKIGFFGGSFNPPHIAHIKIGKYLLKNNKYLDSILYAPSYYTKHKNYDSKNSYKYRYEMTKIAINDLINNTIKDDNNLNYNRIVVSNIEEEYYNKYKDYSYTYEVLSFLKSKDESNKQNNEYIIIIGFDSIYNIKSWHKFDKLLNEYKFIIFDRNINDDYCSFINNDNINEKNIKKNDILKEYDENYGLKYEYINTLDTNYISSSNIRIKFNEYYKTGDDTILKGLNEYLNKSVIDYIIKNNLYKE